MILKTSKQVINILLEISKGKRPIWFISFLSISAFITDTLLLISIGILLRSQDPELNNHSLQFINNKFLLIFIIVSCSLFRILINYKVIRFTHFFGSKIVDGIARNKFNNFEFFNNKTETSDNTFITILANHSFTFVSCLQNIFLGLIAIFSSFSIFLFIYIERSYLSIFTFIIIGTLFILVIFLTNKSLKLFSKEVALNRKKLVGAGKEGLQVSKELFVGNRQKFILERITKYNSRLMNRLGSASFLNVFPRYSIEAFLFIIYGFFLFRNDFNQSLLEELPIIIIASLKLIPSFQAIYAAVATLKLLADSINEIHTALILEKTKRYGLINYFDGCYTPVLNSYANGYSIIIKKEDDKNKSNLNSKELIGEINNFKSFCLYGPSGSGKTTFLQTLIFNTCLKNNSKISENDNKFSIEYLSHIPNFVSGTIIENIKQGDHNLDLVLLEELLLKLKLCSSKKEIRPFLNSKIGDTSKLKLSGGEEQRLSLIRSLCRRPKFLFADEFTSALNHELEQIAYQLAIQYSKNLIFISHSESLIKLSDHKLSFPINI